VNKTISLCFALCCAIFSSTDALAKKAATASRLIGEYHGPGFYNDKDSTGYTYSGYRGGDLETPISFDTRTLYYWDTAAHIFKWQNRNQRTYDLSNRILSDTSYNVNVAGALVYSLLKTYQYDGSGRPIYQLTQQWKTASSSWVTAGQVQTSYSGQDSIMLSQIWDITSSIWVNAGRTTYTRDGLGRVVRYVSEIWNSSTSAWDNDVRYSYAYGHGRVDTFEIEQWNRNIPYWYNYQRNIAMYNTSGQHVGFLRQVNPSAGFQYPYASYDSTVYTVLNTNGLPLVAVYYVWDYSYGWQLRSRTTYTRNAAGNALTETGEQMWYGNLVPRTRYTTTYNSFNQKLRVYPESWDTTSSQWGNPKGYEDRYYYETHSNAVAGPQTTVPAITLVPVPANDVININLSVNGPVHFTATVTDVMGKVLLSWSDAFSGSYSRPVNVRSLPDGNYYLSIQCETGSTAKAFVIRR
jgi:hypothetical protein